MEDVASLVLGPVSGSLDLSLADAKFLGPERSNAGSGVSSAGDADGDGNDDVLVSTGLTRSYGVPAHPVAYLVLSPVEGAVDLSRAAHIQFIGEAPDNVAGVAVDAAGDLDADGRVDLLISAPFNDEGGEDAGAAYLIYGAGL